MGKKMCFNRGCSQYTEGICELSDMCLNLVTANDLWTQDDVMVKRFDQLEKERDQAQRSVISKTDELVTIEASFKKCREDWYSLLEKDVFSSKAIEELNAANAQLHEMNENQGQRLSAAYRDVHSLEDRVGELAVANTQLMADKAKLLNRINVIGNERSELKKLVGDAGDMKATNHWFSKNQDKEREIALLKASINRLENLLATSEAEKINARVDLTNIRKEYGESITIYQGTMAKLERRNADLQGYNDNQSRTIQRLYNKRDAIKAKVEEMYGDN